MTKYLNFCDSKWTNFVFQNKAKIFDLSFLARKFIHFSIYNFDSESSYLQGAVRCGRQTRNSTSESFKRYDSNTLIRIPDGLQSSKLTFSIRSEKSFRL